MTGYLGSALRQPVLLAAGSTPGGDPLSLTDLDEAIDSVDGVTHLVMSQVMQDLLWKASSQIFLFGFITWDKTSAGDRYAYYNDIPILICSALDFNEANPGGGPAFGTSVYAVALTSAKLGKPLKSLLKLHGRPTARIWGVKNADVVG